MEVGINDKTEKIEVTFKNHESRNEFVVTFKKQGAQVRNIEAVEANNQETHQEESSEVRLTKDQLDIVNFCSIPRSHFSYINSPASQL